MNPADSLKLKKSTKLLLWILSIPGAVSIALIIDLAKDSNVYLALKNSKPIDSLLSMVSSINISSVSILISLLFLSLIYNLFLLKRMNLYFKACHEFGKLFYKATLNISKLTKQPVKVQFSNEELTVDYEALKDKEKL